MTSPVLRFAPGYPIPWHAVGCFNIQFFPHFLHGTRLGEREYLFLRRIPDEHGNRNEILACRVIYPHEIVGRLAPHIATLLVPYLDSGRIQIYGRCGWYSPYMGGVMDMSVVILAPINGVSRRDLFNAGVPMN